MYKYLLFNKKGEIVAYQDHSSFEESLKNIYIAIDEHKNDHLSGAFIYKYLNPDVNQSIGMVASIKVIR